MYSLLVVAGLVEGPGEDNFRVATLLESAARRVMAQLPDVGSPLRLETLMLPEIEGGWATIRPELGVKPTLIHQYVDDDLATLVFGQIDTAEDPARQVQEQFRVSGSESVLRLSGVFSAVVIERRRAVLHVLTSIPGCRPLRYYTRGRALYLSPTDLGIVALSGMDVQLDMNAVAATVAFGWAVGGRSALRGVRECSSLERLSWVGGRLEHGRSSVLCTNRVDSRDAGGIERKVEEVIEELRAGVGEQLRYTDPAKLSIALTAGVDSRAALSLVLSQRERSTIESYTRGDESSRDVSVARSVSRRLGIRHRVISHAEVVQGAFMDNARLLAIGTNGSGNSERALGGAFRVGGTPVSLGGGGGEVYRGYYYNYIRRRRRQLDARGVAEALLASPFGRARTSHFAVPELDSAPRHLLHDAISTLADVSADPYDLTDLFYLQERFSRWGSWSWKRSLNPALVPFANSRAILAAFQLPSPIGDHALLARAIERYAPRWLYWLPINGFELLATEGAGAARYLAREGLRGSGKVLRIIENKANRKGTRRAVTPERAAAAYFASEGFEALRGILLAPASISRDLMSPEQLEQRLTAHRQSLGDLPTLGVLLNLEIWRASLRDVAQGANR